MEREIMSGYNPDGLKNKPLPVEGERQSAEVVEIKQGVISDFIKPETLAKWKDVKPDTTAIQIIVKADNGFLRSKVMTYPVDGAIHNKSNLASWRKAYGDYPRLGQKIQLEADRSGLWNFLI